MEIQTIQEKTALYIYELNGPYSFINMEKLRLFENTIFYMRTLENDEFEDTIYYGHKILDEMNEFFYDSKNNFRIETENLTNTMLIN